ncbi:bifunctional cytidylyltransferase/SDR family oxidoreductase [Candidatus Neptunochlamydia vexilliferae]|uniref:2-C-methyl-D-erythritol 4-phosphate cytidylyltransferase n=1 Tax=Candidatus Neptunichlamydia vexilliferae TaxID=1651774 RepID=A0ABS0B0G8_9BACT|nr:bifunctional cytidylyltransferase/SDR family oxidoreductase [Candidatus Neptunochlamydia vexilliferae]MBF5059888.1 2-C-methyl-D-erythritol 4-phosphate cytidylyltransferase [Candidatus Neptunochlamydia vexilliferae]
MIKAILLMSGTGERFGSAIPKQFLNLSGKKIYLHTLEAFLPFTEFQEIILVCRKEHLEEVRKEVTDPRVRVIEGGHTRQDSSYRGLIACGTETTHVVIHDAVRPFISHQIIQDNLDALKKHDAVDTCIPSADTIVHAKSFDTITDIPPRAEYLRGQTPQSFSYPLILEAHEKAPDQNASDDCRLVLNLSLPVHIVPGAESNIKITGELDLFLAEQLMRQKSSFPGKEAISLKGKTFAITGGTGGIGSALATLLKKEGATPLILSKSSPDYPVDLTNFEATQKLFQSLGPLDGLINCVGHLSIKPFHALSSQEIDHLIATNLHTLLYSCHAAQIKPSGHIINLSSSSFSRGRKSYTLYSSAKAAIVNFTQGLAEERPDLHINAIVPQRTATPMRTSNFPSEDPSTLLSPEEVSQEILLLLKQKATGSLFEVRKK